MPVLGAHPVRGDRAYGVLRTLGVVLVFWSLAGGMFLMAGGARQLTAPLWQPLVQWTYDYIVFSMVPREQCYIVIGGILALAGVTGIAGLVLEWRWLSLVSCILDTLWCGYVTAFLTMAQDNPGSGNFITFFAFLATVLSACRYLLLKDVPDEADPSVLRLG